MGGKPPMPGRVVGRWSPCKELRERRGRALVLLVLSRGVQPADECRARAKVYGMIVSHITDARLPRAKGTGEESDRRGGEYVGSRLLSGAHGE